MTQNVIIGIDLGTTYSCVGVCRDGNTVEIIANSQGNRTTPSYVAFTDTERLIGDSAKNQANSNIHNTVFDAKRLIGRNFSDASVQSDMKHFPFKVIDRNGKPYINVNYKGEEKTFTPEEISAFVLTEMKNVAEAYLGHPVSKAVVTVPAYFNDSQRQSTKDAGVIAGLDIVRIINEPTAASIAYGLEKISNEDGEKNVLIFDCGGGTHDISLLTIDGGIFEVKATNGNTHLGGEDFDNRLVSHFVEEIKRKMKTDISQNVKALRRLRTACERAKRALSSQMQTTIELDSLINGEDFTSSITRARFEELCIDLFRDAMKPIDQVLQDAKMDKRSINEIVLVGGSTRIPKIQQLLSEYFGGKELNKSVNPDEAVAYGAAIQGYILSGQKSKIMDQIVVLDVTPLSIGVEEGGQFNEIIIPRNSSIPCDKHKVFSTGANNQTCVEICIFEGERRFTKDCRLLGKFRLEGIPPMPRGQPQIKITCSLDANSILTVKATEESSGITSQVEVKADRGNLSQTDIDRMVAEAEKFKQEDEERASNIIARNNHENYVISAKSSLSKEQMGEEVYNTVMNLIKDEENWLSDNLNATATECEARTNSFKEAMKPYMSEQNTNGDEMPDMSKMDPTQMAQMAEQFKQSNPEAFAKMTEQFGGTRAPQVSELD